jgi:hypothetical protein
MNQWNKKSERTKKLRKQTDKIKKVGKMSKNFGKKTWSKSGTI